MQKFVFENDGIYYEGKVLLVIKLLLDLGLNPNLEDNCKQ